MKSHLAILAWSVSAEQPDLAAAPFVYAAAAAALDCEVEIHFSGPAVKLLEDGVAEKAVTAGGRDIYAFMREAAALNVRFIPCAMSALAHLPAAAKLIPETSPAAGATAFVDRALDPEWRTLVF